MLTIRDLSIKNKLIWMQVFTSVLVLGLCFAAFVATDIKGYKKRKVTSTSSIAQVIGLNSISAIQFLDNEAALKILQQVEPDLNNACIIDKKGNIFADYTRTGYNRYAFQAPFTDRSEFSEDGFLYVYKNIIRNDELYGTVCLQVSLDELKQIKDQNFRIAAFLLILGISFAFLIAIINQRYISNPLLSLVRIMKAIRESGDYNQQVPVKGKDEIAVLSKEFTNLMERIKLSDQKKDEFIGIASHELKTPLTIIKGFLEILSDSELKAQDKFYVQRAINSTNKLQGLVFDLLDVSKIQSGQLRLNMQKFDIDELINECIHNAEIGLSTHKIIREGGNDDQYVVADRNRIEQVITNLLSNAIKYSPDACDIIVRTEATGSSIIVSFKDLGIGVPKADQEKIFDRFYRSNETNIGTSGFGLGLYICAQIIKRHSGKIWVESENEKGSTFYFELPVDKGEMIL